MWVKGVAKENVAFVRSLSSFFLFALAVLFSIIPLLERQSRIPRQSHFLEAGEAWMWAHGSRRVAAEEAGIWLCWISPRCAVCQVREVTGGRGKGRRGGGNKGRGLCTVGVNEGSEVCGEKAAGIGELRAGERERGVDMWVSALLIMVCLIEKWNEACWWLGVVGIVLVGVNHDRKGKNLLQLH